MSKGTILARFVLIAILLALVGSTSGCFTENRLGEIQAASLTSDASHLAVVHRDITSFRLTITNSAMPEPVQLEVAAPSCEWLGGLLVTVTMVNAGKRVTVFEKDKYDAPVFVSKFLSYSPSVLNNRIYYLAYVNSHWQIYSVSTDDFKETPYTDDARDYIAYRILPEGDAFLAVQTAEHGVESSIEALRGRFSIVSDDEEFCWQLLETPDVLAQTACVADIEYFDAGTGSIKVVEGFVMPPGGTIVVDGEMKYLAVGKTSSQSFYEISIRRFQKHKVRCTALDAPSDGYRGILPSESGFFLAYANGIYYWDCRKDPIRIALAYPFEIGGIFGERNGDFLASIAAGGCPSRIPATVNREGYAVLSCDNFSRNEASCFLESQCMFNSAAKIGHDDKTPVHDKFPVTSLFSAPTGLIAMAERLLADGDVEGALEIYGKDGSKYSLRIGEIQLFVVNNREVALNWFAKVSDSKKRKRVDLYLDVLTHRSEKLRESYIAALSAMNSGNHAEMVMNAEQYFKRMDEKTLDPLLVRNAVSYLKYMARNKEADELVNRAYRLCENGRFGEEVKALAADYAEINGRIDECAGLLLKLCELEQGEIIPICERVIRMSLETGSAGRDALKAADRILACRIELEETIRCRIWKLLIGAYLLNDQAIATEEANFLAWSVYEQADTAITAGVISVMASDRFSFADGNVILERFLKNPYASWKNERIAEMAVRSAVMGLEREVYEKGVTAIPDWFKIRVKIVSALAPSLPDFPITAIRLLSEGSCDLDALNKELSASKSMCLAEAIRTIALLMASATPEIAAKITEAGPIRIGMPYFGKGIMYPEIAVCTVPEDETPSLLQLLAVSSLDPRMAVDAVNREIVFGRAISDALLSLYQPTDIPQEGESRALAEILKSGDWDTLNGALAQYGSSAWTVPFWDLLAELGLGRGEPDIVIKTCRTVENPSNKVVQAAILDCLCRIYSATEKTDLLLAAAKGLSKIDGWAGTYALTKDFALALVQLAEMEGDAVAVLKWRTEWLARGGLLSMADDQIREWLNEYPAVMENWAALEPVSVACFIATSGKDIRELLLEKCGKNRAAVEAALQFFEKAEEPGEPDGQDPHEPHE